MPFLPTFCDTCGAIFPSGVFFENVINATPSDKLTTILRNSQVKGLGIDEIRQQVHQEVPELTSILELLPKTHPHVYQNINIILFIITIIISLTLAGHQPAITTQDIINNFYYKPAS